MVHRDNAASVFISLAAPREKGFLGKAASGPGHRRVRGTLPAAKTVTSCQEHGLASDAALGRRREARSGVSAGRHRSASVLRDKYLKSSARFVLGTQDMMGGPQWAS